MAELEVLNEILTSTVAQLFTVNRTSHLKIFKNSSQIDEQKSGLPMGNRSFTAESSVAASEWVQTKGVKFLEETTQRL